MKALCSIFFLLAVVLSSNAQLGHVLLGQNVNSAGFGTNNNSASNKQADNLSTNNITVKNSKSFLGVASLYSLNLEGTQTATGETFLHKYATAASNFFTLNSWVRVTNLFNGKSVIVRINDRMHPSMAKNGRVVDLTISAAKQIGLTIIRGITKVKVEQVSTGTQE